MTQVSQCTGACCAAFPISGGLGSIQRIKDGIIHVHGEQDPGRVRLLDILVPITRDNAEFRQLVAGGRATDRQLEEQHFKCVKWDATTKKCTVYENRPLMCVDFPHGLPCRYCGGKGD